jgi:hypothetical protein
MKKKLLVSGLLLIIVGLILFSKYNVPVYLEDYVRKDSVVNTYVAGSPLQNSISFNFSAGEHIFFNFSRGRYWAGTEELFEPAYTGMNFSIEAFKTVSFEIYTPSNDVVEFEAWMPSGLYTYVIIFYNESEDFTHLPDGNLTFSGAGVEAIVNKSGTYNFTAVSIDPPLTPTRNESLGVYQDPPMEMDLSTIENTETKPYYPLLPAGMSVASLGAIISVWGAIATEKRRRVLKSHYRKIHR